MHVLFRYALPVVCCLLFSTVCHAQKRSDKNRYKGIYKPGIGCPVLMKGKYPYQAIGVKLGDPFALTYKYYPVKHFAIALDLGPAASGLYYKHHRKNFANFVKPDTLTANQNIRYLNHRVKSEWVLEGKLLYQHDATRLLEGLQWYIGAGLQFRKLEMVYEYFFEVSYSESIIAMHNVSDFTMGPTVALGLEYTYPDLPMAFFSELELYADVMENPGWTRFQGGVGMRYIF